MKNELKYTLFIATALLLICAMILVFLWFSKPSAPQISKFPITIKGNITLLNYNDEDSQKPLSLLVYPNVFHPNGFCGLKNLHESVPIVWNGNTGEFFMTLELPIEQQIYLTPDCSNCNAESITIVPEKSIYYKNFTWDLSPCKPYFENYSNSKSAIERATNILDQVSSDLDENNFNATIKNAIRKTISAGRDHVLDAKSGSDENESYAFAMYAIMNGWQAVDQIALAKIDTCYDMINVEFNSHNNSCYSIPYETYADYQTINYTSKYYQNLYNEEYNYKFGGSDINEINLQISYLKNRMEFDLAKVNNVCESTLRIINKSYEYQGNYCTVKTQLITRFQLILMLVILLFGLVLGKFGNYWVILNRNSPKKININLIRLCFSVGLFIIGIALWIVLKDYFMIIISITGIVFSHQEIISLIHTFLSKDKKFTNLKMNRSNGIQIVIGDDSEVRDVTLNLKTSNKKQKRK